MCRHYNCVHAVSGSADGGTPCYMPPEQLVGWVHSFETRHHQGLADLHSIGVSLWTLLVTGDPFSRDFATGRYWLRDEASLLDVKAQLVRLLLLLQCVLIQSSWPGNKYNSDCGCLTSKTIIFCHMNQSAVKPRLMGSSNNRDVVRDLVT